MPDPMLAEGIGIPADEFDPHFVQAEAALMEMDAMKRAEIMGDHDAVKSADGRLRQAYFNGSSYDDAHTQLHGLSDRTG